MNMDFTANKTLVEVIKEGVPGGNYSRINSIHLFWC